MSRKSAERIPENTIASIGSERPTIAIVDDDPSLINLYKLAIESRGCKILYTANNGSEAIEKQRLVSPKPDIIIMNYGMPIMNGIEATKQILSQYPTTKIILNSADDFIEGESLKAGATRFLKKPISLRDLLNNVNTYPSDRLDEETIGKIKRPRGRPEIPEEDRKIKAAYSITKKVADEFAALCKSKNEDYNRLVEGFLKKHIEEHKKATTHPITYKKTHETDISTTAYYKTILVTDDHPRTTEVISDMLEKMGYKTLKAYGGHDCIELARLKKPDLILLDIIMEDMHGWQVAATIKNDPDLKKVPIIMVTGKTPTLDDIYNRLHLIENYLIKPITSNVLKEVVEQVLSSKPKQNIELIAKMAIQSVVNQDNVVTSQITD